MRLGRGHPPRVLPPLGVAAVVAAAAAAAAAAVMAAASTRAVTRRGRARRRRLRRHGSRRSRAWTCRPRRRLGATLGGAAPTCGRWSGGRCPRCGTRSFGAIAMCTEVGDGGVQAWCNAGGGGGQVGRQRCVSCAVLPGAIPHRCMCATLGWARPRGAGAACHARRRATTGRVPEGLTATATLTAALTAAAPDRSSCRCACPIPSHPWVFAWHVRGGQTGRTAIAIMACTRRLVAHQPHGG